MSSDSDFLNGQTRRVLDTYKITSDFKPDYSWLNEKTHK